MNILGLDNETVVLLIFAAMFAGCVLIIMRVVMDIYMCSLTCVKDKLKKLIISFWN